MELVFEKFGVPAMFPAKNAMLSAFSAGRATALVIIRIAIMTLL